MTRHVLAGLRPEPLGRYLAGLGLFRLIAEQADPNATAAWETRGLMIETNLRDLAAWLTERYVPTPIVSPWNEGSGFGVQDKTPKLRLMELRKRRDERFAPMLASIAVGEDVGRLSREADWNKGRTVQEFRNRCPDALLPWIDAAVVLAGDQAFFPPILGTGGNDGRLDFSTNFHQQLLDVLDDTEAGRTRSSGLAQALLDGAEEARLADVPVGQFDPAGAGGQASSPFGSADSVVNPWEYVLLIEGALLFASGTSRRYQHVAEDAARRAAMPFTVDTSPDGFTSGAAGESSRGELWVPVWTRPYSLAEVRQLFGEARAAWRGQPAQRAVDFYAATRTLGVARGIDEFVRYGLHQRNGLAFVAVPEDRVRVRERPEVGLVTGLEDWVSRVRRGDPSSAVGSARRRFERAHMDYVRADRETASAATIAELLGRLLRALTDVERAVACSGRARESTPVRVPPRAGRFLNVLRGAESAELRIAVGVASCATRASGEPGRTMRHLLLPIDPPDAQNRSGRWREYPLIAGLGLRPLPQVLATVLAWRLRTASSEPGAEDVHGAITFQVGIRVPAADLHALAVGRIAAPQLDFWLRACLSLDWRGVAGQWADSGKFVPLPTLGLLHPLAQGLVPEQARGVTDSSQEGAQKARLTALRPDWAVRLAVGQVETVHREAVARLRQAGWEAVPSFSALPVNGEQLGAALLPRCQNPRGVMTNYGLACPIAEKESAADAEADTGLHDLSREIAYATPGPAPNTTKADE